VPYTRGFRTVDDLRRHFIKHGADFACATSLSYEALADAFLGGPLGQDVAECTRPGGDRVRYNQVTQAFGVLGADGFIRTYLILKRNAVHNQTYFQEQCR
jgi:pyocin large subunit-like protein